jgi:hypothetical protein
MDVYPPKIRVVAKLFESAEEPPSWYAISPCRRAPEDDRRGVLGVEELAQVVGVLDG